MEACEQVKVLVPELLVMPALGAAVFWVIARLEVAVHPLAAVTVTVMLETLDTEALAVFPRPPLQAYETPPVAVNEMVFKVQLSTALPELLVIPALGAVVFCVMVMVALDLHPLAAVTVTTYTPGKVTLALALLPRLPLQAYVAPPVAVKPMEF